MSGRVIQVDGKVYDARRVPFQYQTLVVQVPRPRQLRECEAYLKDVLSTDGHGSDVLWGMTKMCAMEKLAVMYKLVPMLVNTMYW